MLRTQKYSSASSNHSETRTAHLLHWLNMCVHRRCSSSQQQQQQQQQHTSTPVGRYHRRRLDCRSLCSRCCPTTPRIHDALPPAQHRREQLLGRRPRRRHRRGVRHCVGELGRDPHNLMLDARRVIERLGHARLLRDDFVGRRGGRLRRLRLHDPRVGGLVGVEHLVHLR